MRIVLVLMAVALAIVAIAAAPAQSAPGESNLDFLLVGSALTWAGFFGYALYVSRRNAATRRELEELRQMLAEREGKDQQPRT